LENPDLKHISTGYVERQDLTMRMQMRRFTRLTNAFSKKIKNQFLTDTSDVADWARNGS
jgi:IS1 family transposase